MWLLQCNMLHQVQLCWSMNLNMWLIIICQLSPWSLCYRCEIVSTSAPPSKDHQKTIIIIIVTAISWLPELLVGVEAEGVWGKSQGTTRHAPYLINILITIYKNHNVRLSYVLTSSVRCCIWSLGSLTICWTQASQHLCYIINAAHQSNAHKSCRKKTIKQWTWSLQKWWQYLHLCKTCKEGIITN